jgi:4-hydroxy-tetrahydrodipicolinate synthase
MRKSGNKKKLEGIIPAIVVPLGEDGQIDSNSLIKQADYLSSAGVHGFFINGTTGEGPWLSIEEKKRVYQIVQQTRKKNQFLCAACIRPSTEMVLEEIGIFSDLKPDYIVAVTPYYYSVSQNDILYHFTRIAKESPVPVIVYHIPQNTNNNIEFSTMLELAKIENIAGIKDSSGNFVNFSKGCLSSQVPSHFSWIQGEDYLDAASMNIGADGIVTGLGNVYIEPYIKMYQAALSKDLKEVSEMQERINSVYEIIQVTGIKVIPSIKGALSLIGRTDKWMKMISKTLSNGEIERVKNILENMGLI